MGAEFSHKSILKQTRPRQQQNLKTWTESSKALTLLSPVIAKTRRRNLVPVKQIANGCHFADLGRFMIEEIQAASLPFASQGASNNIYH
jgi:hypothetical protein